MVSGQTTNVDSADGLPAAHRGVGTDVPAYDVERLRVERAGPADAPVVLVLHGWGSSLELMRPAAAILSDRYRVVSVDLPGHGRSPRPAAALGVPEHADLVRALIHRESERPVAVVGHSNGGRIGLYMASHEGYRDLVAAMILVSPSGMKPAPNPTTRVKRAVAATLKAPFRLLPGRLREFALDWLRHSLVWKALGSSDYRALTGVMRETFVRTVNHHLDTDIPRIEIPVLILWGDKDTAVSRDQMERLREGIPDAGLGVLEGAAHYGHLDRPDIFAAATRHFLEAEYPPVRGAARLAAEKVRP